MASPRRFRIYMHSGHPNFSASTAHIFIFFLSDKSCREGVLSIGKNPGISGFSRLMKDYSFSHIFLTSPIFWHVFFWHVICCNLEPKCDKQISYQLGFLPKLWSKNTQNTQLQIGDPTNNCDWLCWMLSKMPPIGKRHWNFSTSVRAVRNTFLLCFSIGEFPIK